MIDFSSTISGICGVSARTVTLRRNQPKTPATVLVAKRREEE